MRQCGRATLNSRKHAHVVSTSSMISQVERCQRSLSTDIDCSLCASSQGPAARSLSRSSSRPRSSHSYSSSQPNQGPRPCAPTPRAPSSARPELPPAGTGPLLPSCLPRRRVPPQTSAGIARRNSHRARAQTHDLRDKDRWRGRAPRRRSADMVSRLQEGTHPVLLAVLS